MSDEANYLQQRLIRAFTVLRKKHPVIESTLSSYREGHGMNEYDIFSSSAVSEYLNKYGELLKEILDKEEMEYYKKQLKYYKALVLVFSILAEDPTIMDNKNSSELKKVVQDCSEKVAELRDRLAKAINGKISASPPHRKYNFRE
jgi:hypothetical protein